MNRNRFQKQKKDHAALRQLTLPVAVFALVLALLWPGVSSVEAASRAAERESLEQAIRRSAVHCYATEGSYPESLSYLEQHYGIRVDKSRYLVSYEVFASNLMPAVRVIAR